MIQLVLFSKNSSAQNNTGGGTMINRKPVVAGQFYASDKETLKNEVESLFEKASACKSKNVFAVISPHAGFIYSGNIAASAINQIDPGKQYETVFILGASHKYLFDGASVYGKGNFITPLDTVLVDTAISNKIVKSDPVFQFDADYHLADHCIEVQLPFLQYHLKNNFKLVPILIGTNDTSELRKIAEGLKPYLTEKNLFIISTDFSHYPEYSKAVEIDNRTANAIASNSPEELLKTIKANSDKKIDGLSTSLCGLDAVLTFLYMTQDLKDIFIEPIIYCNSGDVSMDTGSVVGYWAISFSSEEVCVQKNEDEFSLTEKDKENLLLIARNTIEDYIKNGKKPEIDTTGFSESLMQKCGAFVTLRIGKDLRGCIGRFMPEKALWEVVREMTVSSATEDYRFNKVQVEELEEITIEISVLSPLKKIKSEKEVILGKHGIYLSKGGASGTFLPQVATETGWTIDEFLGHCARDKAGMKWDEWKTAELYIYSAIVFEEE